MVKVKGVLMGNLAGLAPHDAFFRITSESLEYFGVGETIAIQQRPRYFDVKIDPKYVSATYSAQLETVNQLQLPRNKRWHGILLNQVHDALDDIDLTQPKEPGATIPPQTKRQADEWLLNWMSWNEEQLSVIRGINAAKNGVIIVMGPAGTGKTLLQQALSIYFYLLGFHILALAPANSNVDYLATQLGRIKENEVLPSALKFIRLYPSVRDFTPKDEADANGDNSAYSKRSFLPFYELLSALDEREGDNGTAREHGLVQSVLHAAENHTHKLTRRLRGDNGKTVGTAVKAWDLLREFLAKWRLGGMDREELLSGNNSLALERYRLAYKQCRAHLVGRNRFMLTTTGNTRSQELLQDWYAPYSEWKLLRIGVVVFVDEAAKDLEANVWSGIVCEQWSHGVKGVVLLGDDKQLMPTNTCSRGNVTFNAFNGRLDMPLPCRLVREDFPCYRLLEQRRMNAVISAFPNREIYDGKLRDGAGTDSSLDSRLPGLSKILKSLVAEYGIHSFAERRLYKHEASDADIRLQWLEVTGERVRNSATKSICVKEHVQLVFKILPRLQACFRLMEKRVDEHLMIICAYSYALHEYQDHIKALLRQDKMLTTAEMPRVLTVDASQGQESSMVVFDGSCQNGDVLGFVDDVGRCNVAITRAKEVFWMIGGTMELRSRDKVGKPPALLTKYKRELDVLGKCHRFV